MERIAAHFAQLRVRGEAAFVPFITAGDPDLQTTAKLVRALDGAGADIIELGVPFSDPIADGPAIQRASLRALNSGTTLHKVLELVSGLRAETEAALVLMGYANPYYKMGIQPFAAAAKEAGVDGVICPDLPPEAGAPFYGALQHAGIAGVLLASVTSAPARLQMLARATRGFLYFVSRAGVTSARAELAPGMEAAARAAKAACPLPVCVGFGVSKPAHAREISAYADGVVVGSALVERIAAAPDSAAAVTAAQEFTRQFKAALGRGVKESNWKP